MQQPSAESCLHAPRLRPAALILMVCGQTALAQSVADRLEEADRVLPRVVREERIVMPTREEAADPVSPGLTGGSPWDQASAPKARLPEGTFLIERPGHLVAAPSDRTIFVPETEARLPGEGPMLALPNAALDRLETAVAGTEPTVHLSGEVFVYRDRRYLLISSFRIGAERVEPTPVESGPEGEPVPSPDSTASESALDDPEVRGLLEELESEAPTPTRIDRDRGSTVRPGANDGRAAPAPDGTPVFRRRGRIVRSTSGAWLFVFDNDTEDRLAAASMTLLPCRLLERVEREAQLRGDASEVVLSGRVHVHRGEAYLLPTMMTRIGTTGIVPMR
ncbi:MAG: hypothetical protein AAGA55_10355 [Planctomycetota bacterium]